MTLTATSYSSLVLIEPASKATIWVHGELFVGQPRSPRVKENSIGSTPELTEQLVVEVIVRDLDRSLAFYTALGFTLERRDGGFAALKWGARWLFLDQRDDLPVQVGPSRANVRIVTADVDRVWATALRLGIPVERPIADRYYGLRDFTVRDPDGFGLRFATPLATDPDSSAR
jgi:catechol 2,3-dioxygenase-like lactoylglutathione lyase family enzyme